MGTDLSGILLLVVAAAGVVLILDRLVLKPRRTPHSGAALAALPQSPPREPLVVAYARSLFPLLLAVLLFRSFLYEPFRIPSASMMPGLVSGDFILVSKFRYGLRLPLFNKKVLSTWEPQRGDVVVFHSTSGPPKNLIKRLIGLPGDHIVVHENRLEINGEPVPLFADGRYSGGYGFTGADLKREIVGRSEHDILLAPERYATNFDAIVPPGRYFFMGDNRNDSEDSRFPDVGFVPDDHLVGRAVRIWMNWEIPGWPKLERIGKAIP